MAFPGLFPFFQQKCGNDSQPAQPQADQQRPGTCGQGPQVGGSGNLDLVQVVQGGYLFIDGVQRGRIRALLPADGLAGFLDQLPAACRREAEPLNNGVTKVCSLFSSRILEASSFTA